MQYDYVYIMKVPPQEESLLRQSNYMSYTHIPYYDMLCQLVYYFLQDLLKK